MLGETLLDPQGAVSSVLRTFRREEVLLGGRGKGSRAGSPCCFSHVGPFASGFSPLLALGSASLQECGAVPVAAGPASPPCSGSASEPHVVPPWQGLAVLTAPRCLGQPRGHSARLGRGCSAGAWKRAPSQCASTIVLTPRHMVPSKTAKRNPTADAAKAESWQETARPAKCLLRRRCVVSQQAGSSPGLAPCTPGPFHVPDPAAGQRSCPPYTPAVCWAGTGCVLGWRGRTCPAAPSGTRRSSPAAQQSCSSVFWLLALTETRSSSCSPLGTCAGAERSGCCGGVRAGWVCAAQPGPSLLVSDAGAVALVQGALTARLSSSSRGLPCCKTAVWAGRGFLADKTSVSGACECRGFGLWSFWSFWSSSLAGAVRDHCWPLAFWLPFWRQPLHLLAGWGPAYVPALPPLHEQSKCCLV